jgi:hypothetical protein
MLILIIYSMDDHANWQQYYSCNLNIINPHIIYFYMEMKIEIARLNCKNATELLINNQW